MKVFVYWNSRRKMFSVKALEGPSKGKVIFYGSGIYLKDCKFKVSEAGRQRVLKTGHKNVHAGVQGEVYNPNDMYFLYCDSVCYNPKLYSSFVRYWDEGSIHETNYCSLEIEEGKPLVCTGTWVPRHNTKG